MQHAETYMIIPAQVPLLAILHVGQGKSLMNTTCIYKLPNKRDMEAFGRSRCNQRYDICHISVADIAHQRDQHLAKNVISDKT